MAKTLPEEIILDIISRLPVESVLECRRVCKNWRTLTFHPSFAHLHLLRHSPKLHDDVDDDDDDDDDHNYQNHSCASAVSKVGFITLIRPNRNSACQIYYGEYDDDENVVDEMVDEEHSYTTLRKTNHPILDTTSGFVASCKGLICMTACHHVIKDPVYIFNPITREFVDLPRFTKRNLDGAMVSGFGFNSQTKEFKVVRIYYDYNEKPNVGRVQVYTLGSGSGWRDKGEINYQFRVFKGVLANGAIHWR